MLFMLGLLILTIFAFCIYTIDNTTFKNQPIGNQGQVRWANYMHGQYWVIWGLLKTMWQNNI